MEQEESSKASGPSPQPTPPLSEASAAALPDIPDPGPEPEPQPPRPPTAGKRNTDAPTSIGNIFGSTATDVSPAVLEPTVEVPTADPPTRSLSTPEASAGDATGLFVVSSAQVHSGLQPEMLVFGGEGLSFAVPQMEPSQQRMSPMAVTFSDELPQVLAWL